MLSTVSANKKIIEHATAAGSHGSFPSNKMDRNILVVTFWFLHKPRFECKKLRHNRNYDVIK